MNKEQRQELNERINRAACDYLNTLRRQWGENPNSRSWVNDRPLSRRIALKHNVHPLQLERAVDNLLQVERATKKMLDVKEWRVEQV